MILMYNGKEINVKEEFEPGELEFDMLLPSEMKSAKSNKELEDTIEIELELENNDEYE